MAITQTLMVFAISLTATAYALSADAKLPMRAVQVGSLNETCNRNVGQRRAQASGGEKDISTIRRLKTATGSVVMIKTEDCLGHKPSLSVSQNHRIVSVAFQGLDDRGDEGLDSSRFPLRSKVIHLPGTFGPLLLAYYSSPGASDCSYFVQPLYVVDKPRLRIYESPTIRFSNQGGATIGMIAGAPALVTWDFDSRPYEGHYVAHRYKFSEYLWNSTRRAFELKQLYRSRVKTNEVSLPHRLKINSIFVIDRHNRAILFPEAAHGC